MNRFLWFLAELLPVLGFGAAIILVVLAITALL